MHRWILKLLQNNVAVFLILQFLNGSVCSGNLVLVNLLLYTECVKGRLTCLSSLEDSGSRGTTSKSDGRHNHAFRNPEFKYGSFID